ncbi:hypothetical protein QBC37DRAFT_392686 [Rhypophila decipiens]|uniref:Uncharacterized protein n=1 Tax=Rhypophila decipiens TaxID=261697 RepID=A0AAN6XVU9_9PEZI|nr:hypothetical protein QBC37DRAFT_392686 [Rhypophila decipiens]
MVYDDSCDVDIIPNSDVGVFGVMASFIVIAWMTMALSGWDAWTTWRKDRHQRPVTTHGNHDVSHVINATSSESAGIPDPGPQELERRQEQRRPAPEPTKVKEILIRLIDLQIVTGAGITIAGITQIILYPPRYYHRELINNYWWLTMQSLWVVPDDFLNIASLATKSSQTGRGNSEQKSMSPYIRILAVLASTLLGCFFQTYIMIAENNDNTATGPCYNFLYGPIWDWIGRIWVAMGGSYAVVLILILFSHTRIWVLDTADRSLETLGRNIYSWAKTSYRALAHKHSATDDTNATNNAILPKRILALVISSLAAGFFWLSIQFLAVCAYGEVLYPFVFLVIAGFNTWTTVDIISMRIVNEPLLGDDEKSMSFGQVLPLVLIFSVFLPSMGVAGKETRSKTWTARGAQTLVRTRRGNGNQSMGHDTSNGDIMSGARGLGDPAADGNATELGIV